jgi:hypothetical protein
MYLIHTKQTDKMRRENTKPANISVDYYYLYSFCDFDSSVDTKTLKLDFLCETDRAVSSTMNDPIKKNSIFFAQFHQMGENRVKLLYIWKLQLHLLCNK